MLLVLKERAHFVVCVQVLKVAFFRRRLELNHMSH